jgi:steroid delta-isomerase-like uncharacterized protein
MSTEANKTVIRRFVEEIFSRGDLALVDQLVAPQYVMHSTSSPEPIRGPQGLKGLITTLRTAFPDLRLTVEDMVAEGDRVVDRFIARGTHRGELFGIPPTAKQVAWLGIAIHRLVGGQLVETWASPDNLGLLRQLGAVPPPE